MNNIAHTQKTGLIECEVCLKEIPVSEAGNEEACDYVAHYFGLECYAKWIETAAHKPLSLPESRNT